MTPKPAKPSRAYSYVRFSSPEQAKGDSLRRQTEAAERWCAANGAKLDDTLRLRDLGVSAFKGTNAETGALAAFRDALERGRVPKGSVLLIENLDRLSRQSARKGVRILEEIVENGCDVVTLMDNKRYTAASLDSFDFMYAVLTLMRGNEESKTKAARSLANWAQKYKTAAKHTALTRQVPAWIQVDPKTRRTSLIPERAEIVRRIVDLTLKGFGALRIARTFNEEKVPVWTERSSRAGKSRGIWHESYIQRIQRHPALIGNHAPRKGSAMHGHTVPDVYPAVIDRDTWRKLESLVASKVGRPRTGGRVKTNNAFGRLTRCGYCGSTVTCVGADRHGRLYLRCTTKALRAVAARTGKTCSSPVTSIQYIPAHWALLIVANHAVTAGPPITSAEALKAAEVARDALQAQIERLEAANKAFVAAPSVEAAEAIREMADEATRLKHEWEDAVERTRPGWYLRGGAKDDIAAAIKAATDKGPGGEADRDLNVGLRMVLDHIEIKPETSRSAYMTAHYRGGGSFTVWYDGDHAEVRPTTEAERKAGVAWVEFVPPEEAPKRAKAVRARGLRGPTID
jgi:DNA invertase Pin-like site-specific DNA recombinase